MKKGIITAVVAVAVIFAGNVEVNAQNLEDYNENIVIEEVGPGTAPDTFFENPSDIINGRLRSTSKPTLFWDLSSSTYTANLVEVRMNWLYTNYFFLPNSSGKLYVDYNIKPIEANGTVMKIGVYNMTTGRFEQDFNTPGVPIAACSQIKGLNTRQNYAIAFLAVRDLTAFNGIQGTVKIFH